MIALSGRAFAQPFKDACAASAPAWAYDALAKLAADGQVEGYPDGTFRGDRALTRAEMAVDGARVLERVESIERQVPRRPQTEGPTPAQLQVSRTDIELLLLVAELKDELADLAVRVPAPEEELRALAPRIGNVRVSGTTRFRENVGRFVTVSTPVNGNPNTTRQGADAFPITNAAQYEFKLTFDAFVADPAVGAAASTLHFIAAVMTQGDTLQTFNSGNSGTAVSAPAFGIQPPNGPFGNGAFGSLDSAFLDWTLQWGPSDTPSTVETWLGRFGANPQPNCFANCYPVQFGPFGLLMCDTGATWSDSTADTGVNVADGLRVTLHLPAFADLQAQALIARATGPTPSAVEEAGIPVPSDAYIFGEDAYGVDVNVRVSESTRLGAYYIGNQTTPANNAPGPGGFGNAAQWHTYGPGGGSMNPGQTTPLTPGGYHCAAVAGAGITCPAAGNGGGAYLDSDVLRGVHLDVEYAEWNDAVFVNERCGLPAELPRQLGQADEPQAQLEPAGRIPQLRPELLPAVRRGGGRRRDERHDLPRERPGVTASMSFSPVDKRTVYATYFGGSSVSNGQPLSEGEIGLQYAFVQNAQFWILARSLSIDGVQQVELYRAQIDYFF